MMSDREKLQGHMRPILDRILSGLCVGASVLVVKGHYYLLLWLLLGVAVLAAAAGVRHQRARNAAE